MAAVVALSLTTTTAFAEKRVALVVGNSAYRNVAMLPNPERDAASVAKLFKDAGFDTVVAENNVGNLEFKRAIRKFEDMALDSDIAVVFYAGHGIEIGGVNYLIPVDAMLARDRDAQDEAISLDRLVESVEGAKRLRLVILDACRDNPFGKKIKRTVALRSISPGLGKIEPTTTDTLIAYAAKAGSTAEDGTGMHSPFTAALLDSLTTPGLDVRLAFGRIRDQVMKMTGNRQEPFVYGSLGGRTVALVSTPQQDAPAPTASNDKIVRDYQFAERIGTKEAWESFLAAHSDSFYTSLAKAALDKLKSAPSTAVAKLDHPANPLDKRDMTSLMQFHLKRVGCEPGALDGTWDDGMTRAMTRYNKSARTKFDVKVASLDALESIKEHKSRVCPLECKKGYKAEGDNCVQVACKQGYVHNKDGECVRDAKTAEKKSNNSGGSGQQVMCNLRGCQKVPKGCKVISSIGRSGPEEALDCSK